MNPDTEFIVSYFQEEKIECLFFIILGIISVALAFIFLFVIKYSFYKGIAFPFLLIGIIQLTVGTNVFFRSEKDIERVKYFVKNEPEKIKKEELPRMYLVIKNFNLYKSIEIIFCLIGIFLLSYFFKSKQTFWKGFGIGLLLQASILLSLDLIAKDRAIKYVDELVKTSH